MNNKDISDLHPQPEETNEDAMNQQAASQPDTETEPAAKNETKKITKLEKELATVQAERDSFRDSYQRTFSEFNNYKKRNQTVVAQALKTGAYDTIEKFLPVLDNFERALEHAQDPEDAFVKGMAMVYKQLSDIVTGMGVKEIPALGEPFDPNLHQAIQQVEAQEGQQPDTVVAVVQKGYMADDRILRHSMVIVSK